MGREIRAAFVPEPGWNLLVADYSQIELRLLAHMSADPVLIGCLPAMAKTSIRALRPKFSTCHPLMVTPRCARSAKAVNFGIVYGIRRRSDSLQTLGISRKEAELYIRRYFERYAGVREFIDRTIAEVRADRCGQHALRPRAPHSGYATAAIPPLAPLPNAPP